MAATAAAILPTLFLGHGGGPCFYMKGGVFTDIDMNSPAANFFRALEPSLRLPSRPSSLLVVSAHWEGEGDSIHVQTAGAPPLLFDYYGFPPEAYAITWPAPGPPAPLAARVQHLLAAAGFTATPDPVRGFDHGVFVPLKLAFPAADIPTLQISLHGSLSLERHIALGRALAPLRAEGTLIIGSGFASHNLRDIARVPGAPPTTWAQEWDTWLSEAVGAPPRPPATLAATGGGGARGAAARWQHRVDALLRAPKAAPHFARAHPRVEHLLPLYVALGAADPSALLQVAEVESGGGGGGEEGGGEVTTTELFSQIVLGTASMASFRFD